MIWEVTISESFIVIEGGNKMNENTMYELTLDHTQMLHLHQALRCHNSALCEDYFDNDTPEIPEELKVVSDMYHVIKGVLDKEFTFENLYLQSRV